MHRNLFIIFVLTGLVFASCNRCADCTCTNSVVYTYGADVDEQEKQTIESTTNQALNNQFPEESEEICERSNNRRDESTDDFEAKSTSETFENPGNLEYGYEFTRSCVCSDK